LKILYVCLQPRGSSGASDSHVDGLVTALRELGHEVHLVETRAVAALPVRAWAGLFVQMRSWQRLRSSDVVWLRMHPLGAVAAWLARAPLAVEVNGVAEDFFVAHPALRRGRWLLRAALKYQLRRAEYIVPVTDGLADELRAEFPSAKVTTLPNAVDPRVFHPGLPRPSGAPRNYAVFFGALARWQGIELALAATCEGSWPSDLVLLVIGDGPTRPEVEAAARAAPQRILYLGPLPQAAVAAYVANAKVSLIPKRYHAHRVGQSPLKMYESLSAAVPVIATRMSGVTDVSDFADLVQEVEPTAHSLAEAVAALVADEAARAERGACGRQVVLAAHSWRHRAEAAVRLLRPPS
jgi:glycosyltransferase involved in cell wall biosynthesis